MNNLFVLSLLIHVLQATSTTDDPCPNCIGKMHTREDLALTRLPLIIDKPHVCSNKHYQFVIIIKSGSSERRKLTRSTWAGEIIEHFNIPVLYAIGYPSNASMQEEILREDETYHDLLEFNFLESYYNLTIKTISVLLWYNRHCATDTPYLLYVDDDVLVNVDRLIMYMYRLNSSERIEGWFERAGLIQRKGAGGVSRKDFPVDKVPDYLWGAAVLYPSKIVSTVLIKAIFNTKLPIFFRDDVFINGFIAEEVSIERHSMDGVLLYDATKDDLRSEMILINFPNEDTRRKAWICYRENLHCNRNLVALILKIVSGIGLLIVLLFLCQRSLVRTRTFHSLMHEFDRWRRTESSTSHRRLRTTMGISRMTFGFQSLINVRKILMKLVFFLIVFVTLCYWLMK